MSKVGQFDLVQSGIKRITDSEMPLLKREEGLSVEWSSIRMGYSG